MGLISKNTVTLVERKTGYYLLSEISTSVIAKNLDELSSGITVRGTKRSDATTNRYFAALSHVFTIAIKRWEWLESAPMDRMKKNRNQEAACAI